MILGNGLFTLGMYDNDFIIMLIGRCIYGISAESFAMAETPLLYEYFWGKELSFALGFNLSFSRLGSAANDVITYRLYQSNGVVFAIAMGAFVLMPICFLLLSVLMVYRVLIEHKTDALMSRKRTQRGFGSEHEGERRSHLMETKSEIGMTTTLMTAGAANNGYSSHRDGYETMDQRQSMTSFNEMDLSARYDASMTSKYEYSLSLRQQNGDRSLSTKNVDHDYDVDISTNSISEINGDVIYNAEEVVEGEGNRFRFQDFGQFDLRFWLLVVNCCFQYGAVVPWMKIGGSYMQLFWVFPLFIQVKYGYDHHKANQYLTIPYLVAAVITPIIGFVVDKIGRRCQSLLIATIVLTLSHYDLGWLTPDDFGFSEDQRDILPLMGLIGLGLGYSVFCAVIWPSFAIVIPDGLIGTGYGIPTSAYNLVLGLFFLLVGVLTKEDDNLDDVSMEKYRDVEWFLLSTCLCSIGTVFILWYVDKSAGNMLALPAKEQLHRLTMSSVGARDY